MKTFSGYSAGLIRYELTVQDGVATEIQANKRRRLAGGLYTLDNGGLPQVPTPEWMPVLGEQVQVIMEYMGVGVLPVIGACLGYLDTASTVSAMHFLL
mmetsp:Transcript_14115/g.19774  ORF Transcript_14115/g.19774 Transcript_14115/m.19774 type:complete len:98 (+) Transcript_14115:765-1058(+)